MTGGWCGKRRYRDKQQALRALHLIRSQGRRRGKTPTRVYPCPHCNGWHLTSQEQRT